MCSTEGFQGLPLPNAWFFLKNSFIPRMLVPYHHRHHRIQRGGVTTITRTGCDWGGGGVERVCVGVCGDVGVGGWRGAYESRPMKGRGFSCLSTACTIGL